MKHTRRSLLKGISGSLPLVLAPTVAAKAALSSTQASSSTNSFIKKQVLRPRKIGFGSTIGLVATATQVDQSAVEWAIENIESLGFNVKVGKHITKKFGYLAGTDIQRAEDFNAMLADDEVDAIWCVKGGWGSARILDFINYDSIRKNPKAIIGYSDVTSLLNAIYTQTGLITFHGPNAIYGESEYSENHLLDMLLDTKPKTIHSHEEAKLKTITPGLASGKLIGGNLTVLTSILGSPYAPDFNGAILFLEDVSEPAYKIDRMLTQLKLAGVLDRINGVVFGTCSRCVGAEESFTIDDVLEMHIKPLGVPAFSGASIGHILHKMTLPVGVKAQINSSSGTIKILDSMFV